MTRMDKGGVKLKLRHEFGTLIEKIIILGPNLNNIYTIEFLSFNII